MSPRRQANLNHSLAKGVPTLPSPPPYTPLRPPPIRTGNQKVQSRKGREPGDFESGPVQYSPPPAPSRPGMELRRSDSVHRLGGKVPGAGITHRGPARAAAPSLAPGTGGKGKRGQRASRWEWGTAPCGLLRAHPHDGQGPRTAPHSPPSRPRERADLAQPSQLRGVGGGADG